MYATVKLNEIDYNTKQRILSSGIISESMSEDEAFLRLRFYYQQAPLSIYLSSRVDSIPLFKCEDMAKKLAEDRLVITPQAVCELTGAALKDVTKIIKELKLKKLHIPEGNILYGLRGEFYFTKDMSKVLLRLSNGSYTMHDSNRNTKRSIVGFNLRHPDGVTGVQSAQKLFETECKKLLNPPAQDKGLTYETLDYSKLDWRAVCRQPAFKHLRQLYDCPNNEYLSEYLSANDSERTLKLLSDLATKAGKPVHSGKPSESMEAVVTIKSPPRESKSQETYKTVGQMMHTMPRQDLFDFIEVHNSWYSAGSLSTVEEFVKRTRDLAVDVLQYGAPGGNVFLDTKNAYRLHGCPEKFSFDNQKWEPKDFFMDFNISFDKTIKPFHRDNLQGADVLAVGSHKITEFLDLMAKYVADPSIKPQ